jgi:hypothetical protein
MPGRPALTPSSRPADDSNDMSGRLGEILLAGAALGALWCWLQYGPWGGVRYQRRAAWLRPAMMRRVLRAARRKEQALDREIRAFLRRAASRPAGRPDRVDGAARTGGDAERNEGAGPDTLKRQSGPTHRRPGRPL